MIITLIQHNPTLGNYALNQQNLNAEFKKYSQSLCLTSGYALLGNPWQSIANIGGFQSRVEELTAKFETNTNYLVQSVLAEPVWISQYKQEQIIFKQDFFEIENIKFFAPHSCNISELCKLTIPEQTQIVYLACAEQFYEGLEVEQILQEYAKLWKLPIIYLNSVGVCDGFVYAGQSMLISKDGKVLTKLKAFSEDSYTFEFDGINIIAQTKNQEPMEKDEVIFQAICLAIKDYAKKCNIKKAIIGISGGMDSALVAVLACEALGAENVTGIMMPSKFSTSHSLEDAKELVQNLNMPWRVIPIQEIMSSFENSLGPSLQSLLPLDDPSEDMTFENLQARIRGNILMAYANRTGAMVLGTGNKSEIAMGYCTLYGDTVGALEPIGDIYKTRVYNIAKWYNKQKPLIPEHILVKAPSAELRPEQKDEDSLPPYHLLDEFLYQVLEQNLDPNSVFVQGLSLDDKNNILSRLRSSEFKRKQAPFTVVLSCFSFGQNWNIPISAKGF